MANQDKELNAVSTAKDGAYIYAEDANGNQIKISKADLASVVAGILGIVKSYIYTQISYQSSVEMDIGGVGILLVQVATYSNVYHLATISGNAVNIISGNDVLTTNSGDANIYLSASNEKLMITNNKTSNNLVIRAHYFRMS